jgi:hypothetical protein
MKLTHLIVFTIHSKLKYCLPTVSCSHETSKSLYTFYVIELVVFLMLLSDNVQVF